MYRQAIETKFMGPTNYRGERIMASCLAGNITVLWNYEKSIEENHTIAATKLIEKLKWDKFIKKMSAGVLKNGNYVFVQQE